MHDIPCIKMTPSCIEWGLLVINPNAAAALRVRERGNSAAKAPRARRL